MKTAAIILMVVSVILLILNRKKEQEPTQTNNSGIYLNGNAKVSNYNAHTIIGNTVVETTWDDDGNSTKKIYKTK